MKAIFKMLFDKIKKFCRKTKVQLKSTQQEHWVDHICDETVTASKAAVGGYCNLHGFREGSEGNWTYWVGCDFRSFFIRVQDVVIKCKNKSTYDYWISKAKRDCESVIWGVLQDSNLNAKEGDEVNTEFVFKWADEEKSFDIHLGADRYAEEK